MNNQAKEQAENQAQSPQQKIISFSESAYSFAAGAFVVFIVMGLLQVLVLVWMALGLQIHTFGAGVWSVQIPDLFRIDDTGVYLPGIVTDWSADVLPGGIFAILRTAGIVVILHYTKSVFKMLYKSGSPFDRQIVERFKRITIALIVVGALSGLFAFVAAGVVWFLYLIFDYGCVLQDESDATL